ncbi:hypothetical protein CBA19CS22_38330 [Caballeronia novacaledonica]|uniref:Uncharacterized protein n=1 Tax=Caballeronia novacaledonica TaxID=1544861 RepID=A0ACB5R6N9_9BURK|nr:hypothetical protein CBA19CS22_38330 [Caballeronia novacaledonica]
MAGAKEGDFAELVSPFLKRKLADIELKYGRGSAEWNVIALQYLRSPLENNVASSDRRRHYESELQIYHQGEPLHGVERLYKRTLLIEPTTACASHCRWCLRGQYPIKTLTKDDVKVIARYVGESPDCVDVDEVLITGGDPFMHPRLLRTTVEALGTYAPNVKTIRIGTRMPFQSPERINDELLSILVAATQRIEVAINVNHPLEFWDESTASLRRLLAVGARIYNQNPLLKGVNDHSSTLIELYDSLRNLEIESHYLFHAIPMAGMSHHRTSIAKGLHLAQRLCSSGTFSGRSKPRFALLTDIGKVVLYEGSILKRRPSDNSVLVQTGYRPEDRTRWNPSWSLPNSVEVDDHGFMTVWYRDGNDDTFDLTDYWGQPPAREPSTFGDTNVLPFAVA